MKKMRTANCSFTRVVFLSLATASFFLAFDVNPSLAQEPSRCFGTTANGSLENGWKLPSGGGNFRSYSSVGRMLGRTYVHSSVFKVVLGAYAAAEKTAPGKIYVYGETGKRNGGEFAPHKTHRNGLSVDFMVPLLNEADESVPMRTSVLNKWGYDLQFDEFGRLDDLRIDAEAMSEHIYQLHLAAKKSGIENLAGNLCAGTSTTFARNNKVGLS